MMPAVNLKARVIYVKQLCHVWTSDLARDRGDCGGIPT